MVQLILIILGLVSLVAVYIKIQSKLDPAAKLGFITAIILFILSLIPQQESKDYFELYRPNLEPSLVIDTIKDGRFTYHFLVENTGQLKAYNLVFIHKAPDFFSMDNFSTIKPRELAAHGKMDVMGFPIGLNLPKNNEPLTFTLVSVYSAEMKSGCKNIISQYSYLIAQDELNAKAYNYWRAEHKEGKFSDDEMVEFLGVRMPLKVIQKTKCAS